MKYKLQISLTTVILLLILSGCIKFHKTIENDHETTLIEYYGQKIESPDSLISIQNGQIHDKSFSLAIYIDGYCDSCLKQLEGWNDFLKNSYWNEKVSCKFYIHHYNFELIDNYLKQINFPYAALLDTSDRFVKINKLPEDPIFNTILLNEKNEIMVIGNPLLYNHIKSWYDDYIDKKIKSK